MKFKLITCRPEIQGKNILLNKLTVMDGCCGRAQLLLKMNLLIFQRKILSDIVVGLPAIRVKNFDVKLHNNIAISAKRTKDICSIS